MTVGSPSGLDEDDVQALATEAIKQGSSFAFRTGSFTSSGPSIGEAFEFRSGNDIIVGEDIERIANGRWRLKEGVYLLSGVIRSANYSSATGLIVWQWKDFDANQYIGNQAIHYPNSATSRYTHQPVMVAPIVVPEDATADVGPAFVASSGGLSYSVTETRSSTTIQRVA